MITTLGCLVAFVLAPAAIAAACVIRGAYPRRRRDRVGRAPAALPTALHARQETIHDWQDNDPWWEP